MPWPKRLLIVVLLLAVPVAGIKLVHMRQQQLRSAQPSPQPAMVVQTATIAAGSLQKRQHYRGVLQPERSIALTPRIQGRIETLQGQAGDAVAKGQLLVTLDDRELRQAIEALQAEQQRLTEQIWLLQRTYARQQKLVKGAVSQEQLDETRSRLQQARASRQKVDQELQQAQTRLSYTQLKAPVKGRIHRRLQEPGDMAQPGQAVMQLESEAAGYNVHVRVPPVVQAGLEPGQEVMLRFGQQSQKAVIRRIHPATAPNSPLVEVEVFVSRPPFGLAAGASLQVALQVAEAEGLLAPARALLPQQQGAMVYTLDQNQRLQGHHVQVLAATEQQVDLAGPALKAGQQVVVAPLAQLMRLQDGMLVQPATEPGS